MQLRLKYQKLQLEYQSGNFEAAYQISKEILRTNSDPNIMFLHAVTCHKLELELEAEKFYKKCLNNNKFDEKAAQNILILYNTRSKHSSVIQLVENKNLKLNKSAFDIYLVALENRGSSQKTLQKLQAMMATQTLSEIHLIRGINIIVDYDRNHLNEIKVPEDYDYAKFVLLSNIDHQEARLFFRSRIETLEVTELTWYIAEALLRIDMASKLLEFFTKSELSILPTFLANNIGVAAIKAAAFEVAIKLLTLCVEREPNNEEFVRNLASALYSSGELHDLSILIESYPEATQEQNLILQKAVGNFTDVKKCYQQLKSQGKLTTNIITTCADLWSASELANLSDDIASMSKNKLSEEDRINLEYSKFILFEKQGNYEEAWLNLNKVNQTLVNRNKFDLYSFQELMLQNIKALKREIIPDIYIPEPLFQPIFVIGMPRSGTTLLEQVIGQADEIHQCGEINSLNETISQLQTGELEIENSLEYYLNTYQIKSKLRNSESKKFILDKSPLNFKWIYFILAWRKYAKIIFIQRDKVETCWSNFRTKFIDPALSFSASLEMTKNVYESCYHLRDELISSRYCDSVHTVKYENLIEVPNREFSNIFAYLGLEWNDRYLDLQNNVNPIQTASLVQARTKIKNQTKTHLNYMNYI